MPLVKAQCTNCGGVLEVDNSKDAAICPFCNTPYIVEQAINKFNVSNSSINIQSATFVNEKLDADTMFENWLMTNDKQLRDDFQYNYGADPRSEYIRLWREGLVNNKKILADPNTNIKRLEQLINSIFVGERFGKYHDKEMQVVISLKQRKIAEIIVGTAIVIFIIVAILLKM